MPGSPNRFEHMAHEDRAAPSFAEALVALGTHPSVALLRALEAGALRLSTFAAENPALDNDTLSAILRELDSDGLIARRVDPGPPLRVLYELTERGAALAPALDIVVTWIAERS